MDCADDAGISTVKKEIATMEGVLQKLSEQEAKYTAELNDALQQYPELKEQAAEFDADELLDARLDLRPALESSAVSRVQFAYGERYDLFRMYDSKRDVSKLLGKEAELRAVEERRKQRQKLTEQPQRQIKSKNHEQER